MVASVKLWYEAAIAAIRSAPDFEVCQCGRPVKVRVTVALVPPTNQRLDIDNRIKPVHDALEKSGLIENDDQVKSGEQVLLNKLVGGAPVAVVTVEQLPPTFGDAMVEIPRIGGRTQGQ